MIRDKLIELFENSPGVVISKKDIYESCWGVPWYEGCENTLRVTISEIRDYLSGEVFSTKGGYVYYE